MKLLAIFITVIISHANAYMSLVKRSDSVDWRTYRTLLGGHPVLSEVKDQMGCGNCFGFAITGAVEARAAITLDQKVVPLSQQFFVDCFDGDGCAGGSLNTFLKEMEKEQYVPAYNDYKYVGYYDETRCAPLGEAFSRNEEVARNGMANYLIISQRISNNYAAIDEALKKGPTINGMYISNDAFHWNSEESSSVSGVVDSNCVNEAYAHAWTFVGYTPEHYIIKGSYGKNWAAGGYVNYNKENNINCNLGYRAYSVTIIKRKEIEYKVGKGMLSFSDAKAACITQFGDGWTLAVIPSAWHLTQAYDVVKARYGDDKKDDDKYNYVWIGLRAAHDETKVRFVDDTPAYFRPITGNNPLPNVKMAKYLGSDGGWKYEAAVNTLRFVCSRFRSEECPRKFWMDIGDHALSVTYSSLDIIEGTTMTVKCKSGYIPNNNDGTATCTGGKWSTDITCDMVPTTMPIWMTTTGPAGLGCPKFDISSFSISKAVQKYSQDLVAGIYPNGSTLQLKIKSCKSGFKKKLSKDELKCENGRWSDLKKNPCVEKKRKEVRRAII